MIGLLSVWAWLCVTNSHQTLNFLGRVNFFAFKRSTVYTRAPRRHTNTHTYTHIRAPKHTRIHAQAHTHSHAHIHMHHFRSVLFGTVFYHHRWCILSCSLATFHLIETFFPSSFPHLDNTSLSNTRTLSYTHTLTHIITHTHKHTHSLRHSHAQAHTHKQ